MSEFKGTKGNWILRKFIGGQMSVRNLDDTRKICVSRVNNSKESEANLLLISKAPEMLEALKQLIKEYDLGIVKGIDALRIKKLIKEATEI